jgi:ABC-2 type transport system permease protein
MVSGAAMFLAIGAVTSQLGATRGQAATLAGVILGAAYIVRMVADSRTSLGWMRWLSPIGWLEEMRPLQDPRPLPVAAVLILVLTCAVLAVWLAGRRDVSDSMLKERATSRGKGRLLLGPTSLALRVSRTSLLSWLIGIATLAAMYGSLARAAANLLADSPAFAAALGRLGARGASEGYLGLTFMVIGAAIALAAASQISAIRAEEAGGRLDNLLVQPVRRVTWLAGRLGSPCVWSY